MLLWYIRISHLRSNRSNRTFSPPASTTDFVLSAALFQDGSLPFARSIKDIPSEFRLLSKLTELLKNHGEKEEALQYATLAVQIAGKTGACMNDLQGNPCYQSDVTLNTEVKAFLSPLQECRWMKGQPTIGWLPSTTSYNSTRWQKTTTSSRCPSVHLFCSTLWKRATTPRSTVDWAI